MDTEGSENFEDAGGGFSDSDTSTEIDDGSHHSEDSEEFCNEEGAGDGIPIREGGGSEPNDVDNDYKKGIKIQGTAVKTLVNYFKISKAIHSPEWCIYQYKVDFEPIEEQVHIRKQLFRKLTYFNEHIYDGSYLLAPEPISQPFERTIQASSSPTGEHKIIIKFLAPLEPTDPGFTQFFNITIGQYLSALGYAELGCHFYDQYTAVEIPDHKLEVWTGYKTSFRQHENDVMLCVELTHMFFHKNSCFDIMRNIACRCKGDLQYAIKRAFVGTIVMTKYNRKTYRIYEIYWSQTPTDTFETMEGPKSFVDYYKEKYGMFIHKMNQPLLLSRPTKRKFHRGIIKPDKPLLLVPELCIMTGLSDEMRKNAQLMKVVNEHVHVQPEKYAEGIRDFMKRLQTPEVLNHLQKWNLKFSEDLAHAEGREVPFDDILFGREKYIDNYDQNFFEKGNFSDYFLIAKVYRSVTMDKYVIVCTKADFYYMDTFIDNLLRVSRSMNFPVEHPLKIMKLRGSSSDEFTEAITEAIKNFPQLQMVVVVLPDSGPELYAAIKRLCCVDYGVASQCIQSKTVKNTTSLMNVCTKLSLQMLAKLGGAPWGSSLPMKGVMVVGFDVYHTGNTQWVYGAMVATISDDLTRYYNAVSLDSSWEQVSQNLCINIKKCLQAYCQENGSLPLRIFLYRDGVSQDQLSYVYTTELEQIQSAINSVYGEAGLKPKTAIIVVNKRIKSRIMLVDASDLGRIKNPSPGTIVDSIITFPQRYDFFLVAQNPTKGIANPTHYTVIYDTSGLSADKIQRFTFKLCSMFFNYAGSVAVPAPCQYARKLAFLAGTTGLGGAYHEGLTNKLYFL